MVYFSSRFISLTDKLTTVASKHNSSEISTVDSTHDSQCGLWKILKQSVYLSLWSLPALINLDQQAGRTKRPSWFNVAEADLCVCLLCKFMQNKLMPKCSIATRDIEIQIQPILSRLFPESKAQSRTTHTENAKPTWARSPGSVGNLRSMCVHWFHQESLYGSGSKRNFLHCPWRCGCEAAPPPQASTGTWQ